MGWWIELRCDVRKPGGNCYSDNNNGPMEHAMQSRAGAVMTSISASARRSGWVLRDYEWICPDCAKDK